MFRQKMRRNTWYGISHFVFSVTRSTLEFYLIFGVWSYWLSNNFVTSYWTHMLYKHTSLFDQQSHLQCNILEVFGVMVRHRVRKLVLSMSEVTVCYKRYIWEICFTFFSGETTEPIKRYSILGRVYFPQGVSS
jgi:hypothetical protein